MIQSSFQNSRKFGMSEILTLYVSFHLSTSFTWFAATRNLGFILTAKAGRPSEPLRWYQDSPLITELPYPVPDPERPWGSTYFV